MYIKKFDRKITVLNPTSRSIPDLDAALLSGVVRHPDSADLAQDGNVFILGHSSYLPNVMNKSFQAFNGIQELQWGDVIELTANGYVMTYEVEKVYKARAQDVTVPIAGTGPRLTLATCNSFGSTDDRYIVEAKRVSIKAL
jgi:LPXTG-site transpeptidase (sortase) family protein